MCIIPIVFYCLSSCKFVHSVHLNQTRGVGEYGCLSKGNQSFFTQAFQFRLRHSLSVLRLFTNLFYHPLITIFFVLFIVCYYFGFFDFIAATWCRWSLGRRMVMFNPLSRFNPVLDRHRRHCQRDGNRPRKSFLMPRGDPPLAV